MHPTGPFVLAALVLLGASPRAQEPQPAPRPAPTRPNLVLIVADDLGYADLGVQGCKDVPTPHIDSLAAGGVRMTQGYVSCPVCSPMRAGLLSGRYQQRFGYEFNPGPERAASKSFGLPRSEKTLAERLGKAGYKTGMFGKWHLGYAKGMRPTERGFDEFWGFLSGARGYFKGSRAASPILDGTKPAEWKDYLTTELGRRAAAFVERHRQEPFFLYLPFNAVHTPMHATEADLKRFDSIEARRRKTLAAMLASMDDAVGLVLAKLEEHELTERTLVVFLSDNGGPTRSNASRNTPLRGFKGTVYEGGVRIPFLVKWPGKLPAGSVFLKPISSLDLVPTLCAAAGVAIEEDAKLDGVDLLPWLAGEKKGAPHDALFWRMGEMAALRAGDLKLLRPRGGAWELYDLAKDIGETKDLAKARPEDTKELVARWESWSAELAKPAWPRRGGARARRGRLPTFRQLDKDGDGKLGPEEMPTRRAHAAADADADGFVTRRELRAFRRRRR